MAVARTFDRLFVDQLLARNVRGETIYYPNGPKARGYLVPPDREAAVRLRLRLGALVVLVVPTLLAVLVPRLLESWGFVISTGWFIAGAALALVAGVAAVIYALSRLTIGLATAPSR